MVLDLQPLPPNTRMSSATITAKPQGADPGASRRLGSRCLAYFLLTLIAVLAGPLVYVLKPCSSFAPVQVKGTVTTDDIHAIRAELRRAHWREVEYSLTHRGLRSFWDQVSVVRSLSSCTLVSIQAFGNTAVGDYRGRSWKGKKVTIQRVLHKSAGAWSCTAQIHEGF